jgi:hypothetical protein
MDLGVTETDQCPFAERPDMTGCDCNCRVPRPRGFWAALKWWFSPVWCTSGRGGCGNGRLPCPRFEEWRKANVKG